MPGGGGEAYDVFLSHSSRDKPWVGEFAQQLGDKGLRVFYDADAIEAGGNFRDAIGEALWRTHTKLVVLLTHNSIQSGWVRWEFDLVANEDPANREGRIVFVYLEDVDKDIPPGWRYTSSPVILFDEARRKQDWGRLLKTLGLAADVLPVPSLDISRAPLDDARFRGHLDVVSLFDLEPLTRRFATLHPPSPPSHFVGRGDELRQMDAALLATDKRSPFVAVVGIGGQGKSTLVWHWLTTRQAAIPHEVVFYSTAYRGGFSFLRFLESALIELGGGRIDLREIPRAADRAARLVRLMAERPTLLVLDGIERWLRGWEGADDPMSAARRDDVRSAEASEELDLFLREVAALANGSQLLLTTRALPKALEGNLPVVRISSGASGPLASYGAASPPATHTHATPRNGKLGGLDPAAALALLRAFGVEGDDATLLAAAHEYGNHPLALGAMAFNLVELYGGDIARLPDVRGHVELEDKISALLSNLEKHRPGDMPILQVASLCFDEAPLPAIRAGLGSIVPSEAEIRERMVLLARWGIVDFDGSGEGVVRLHPLISGHFKPTVADPKPIHLRLSEYFAAIPIPNTASTLDDARPRILAVEHAFAADNDDLCRWLLFTNMNEWCFLDEWFGVWGHFEFAIALERRLAGRAKPDNRAAFLNSIGEDERLGGDLAAAFRHYNEAISILAELVEKKGRHELRNNLAGGLQNRGLAHWHCGDLDKAIEDYNQAIRVRRELVVKEGGRELQSKLAMSLQNRAIAHRERGDLDKALEDYGEAIGIYRECVENEWPRKFRNDLSRSLQNRAGAHSDRGNLDNAIKDYNEAIGILRELVEKEGRREFRNDLAMSLLNRAAVYHMRGDLDKALEDSDKAVVILRELVEIEGRHDLQNELARSLMSRAVTDHTHNNPDKAIEDFCEAIRIGRELVETEGRLELRDELAERLQNRAVVYHTHNNPDKAIADYDEAIGIFHGLVEKEGRRELRNNLAISLLNRAEARAERSAADAIPDADEGFHLWRDLLAEGQRHHRPIFIKSLAAAAQGFDVPAGRTEQGVARVHEGLDVLETALSEPDGWNEVLEHEAADFFELTGQVLEALRAAGLDVERYRRVAETVGRKTEESKTQE